MICEATLTPCQKDWRLGYNRAEPLQIAVMRFDGHNESGADLTDYIGKMFELRSTAVKNETVYEKAMADLLLQQEKTNACMQAIAAKDDAAITANCK